MSEQEPFEVMDAVTLVERLTEGKLTEKDRLLVYRGGLLMATEELMRLYTEEEVAVDLEVLTIIRDIFQNLDEYETAVVLARVEAVEDAAEFTGGPNWESADQDEPTNS